jgi:hypothetical protein
MYVLCYQTGFLIGQRRMDFEQNQTITNLNCRCFLFGANLASGFKENGVIAEKIERNFCFKLKIIITKGNPYSH